MSLHLEMAHKKQHESLVCTSLSTGAVGCLTLKWPKLYRLYLKQANELEETIHI